MKGRRSPWSWIPTLYIAEGLPYFAVNTLTVLMYTNLGMSKTEMAFYTGWLYLPWVIKPFWSPFVDLFKTKRLWTVSMQICMAVSMALIAFSLPTSIWMISTLVAFWMMAFFSATHDIAADGFYMLALDGREQAAYVGVRSTFYRIASVIGQGGLVILAGYLEQRSGDVPYAWALTFGILSILFFSLFFYHSAILPRPADDKPMPGVTASGIVADFLKTFITFFRKPYILTALAFMMLYRLPEALCIKLVQPFLKDNVLSGGLGLSTAQIGFANGTVGVISLLAGGILGGLAVAKGSLKRWIWPMAASLGLPCVVYCYMAAALPENYVLISTLIGIEQFGYGFGFTAFMLYLMYFSRGESTTSHYAFCTAFMALGMMLPGMAAGWIYEQFNTLSAGNIINDFLSIFLPDGTNLPTMGYFGFFVFVMLTTLVTFGVTYGVWRTLDNGVSSSQDMGKNS